MLTTDAGRRAGVLGSPVGHSLSPVLHRAAYAGLGLTGWRYDRYEVPDAAALERFLAGCDDTWAGLSLTMPLKRVVQPLLVSSSPVALATGSVNTVLATPQGWTGDNTDVLGLVRALQEVGATRDGAEPVRAVVLGAGATAASALAALADLGVRDPVVVLRDPTRAVAVHDVAQAMALTPRLVRWGDATTWLERAEVVVSTVPSSAHAAVVADWGVVRAAGLLLDVTYHPWPTPLATAWQQRGGTAAGGFGMLLHQAAAQVRLMTGQVPDVERMRTAGLTALSAG